MQWARNLILVALAIVSYLLILAWQKDYGSTSVSSSPESAVNRSVDASKSMDLPAVPSVSNTDVPVVTAPAVLAAASPVPSTTLIHVKTDVLDLHIDPVGGDVVSLSLPTYTKTVNGQEPFTVLV